MEKLLDGVEVEWKSLGDVAEYAKDPLNPNVVLSGDSSLGNNRNQNLDLTKKY